MASPASIGGHPVHPISGYLGREMVFKHGVAVDQTPGDRVTNQ